MMKKYYYWLLALCMVLPAVSGCSSDDGSPEDAGRPTIDNIQQTETGAKRAVLFAIDGAGGLKLSDNIPSQIKINAAGQISGDGFSFSEAIDCNNLSELPAHTTVEQWNTRVSAVAKKSYWVRYQLPSEVAMCKLRIAYIDGINVGMEYNTAAGITIENENANTPAEGQDYVGGFEMPRLVAGNTYVEHTTTFDGATVLNYALEWDASKKHARWVAFSFDAATSVKNVNRIEDSWAADPLLPADMQTDNSYHNNDGFDRGHLCASNDRVFSSDANKQTFYFSNISPQLNSFNGGFWATFEALLTGWVRTDEGKALGTYDKVYVAKGGTLDQLLVNFKSEAVQQDEKYATTDGNGLTVKGLPVPKYYFMAVLAHKAGASVTDASAYQTIAFWTEHRDDYGFTFNSPLPAADTKKYAISIDELETKTGIDFFCNLPDDIELAVESNYNAEAWTW